ncbi:type II secretion system protein GspM [Rhodomicrobium lacus]|uniref:type II secretion system protein GspM n=1 Tax=Rhodomicrobium lacus TaxID=2498452 RepID=UPI000F8CF1F0|nr:type II secretion system protein GspM [Rhodomicrobium lacus]
MNRFRKFGVAAIPFMFIALAWGLIFQPLYDYYGDLKLERDSKNETVLRYRSLLMQQKGLEVDLEQISNDLNANGLFFDSINADAAAALLQQRLATLVTVNGGQVKVSRIETGGKPKADGSFSIALVFAISNVGLSRMLYQIDEHRPVLVIGALTIKAGPVLARVNVGGHQMNTAPITAEDPILDVSLTVSGFLLAKG